jgi:hypothetical protein
MFFVRIFIFFLFFNLVQAEDINKKYQTNANCKACHLDISKKWETSRHAHSHYSKNELYNKALEYIVAKEVVGTKEEVVVECAKCHNPRIKKRAVSNVEKIEMLLEIDKDTMNKMINTAYMQNGINCIVCHNVEEIHQDKKTVGFDAVKFGPQGVMYGPFDGAKSPYHFTKKKDFFKKEPNKLCMVCHLQGKNRRGVEVYSTGKEYLAYAKESNSTLKSCIDCHMSAEKKGIASNYGGKGGRVTRMIRDHLFASIDNSDIHKKYILISAKIKKDNLMVKVTNKAPHKIPTGYGLREIAVSITFYDKNEKKLDYREYSFSTDWLDKYGKLTTPHLAYEMGEDRRLPPAKSKEFLFSIPKGTKIINYRLVYRQIKRNMIRKLKIKDEFFIKDYILKNGILEY